MTRSEGWQSHGGHGRLHPARALPLYLTGDIPAVNGRVSRIILVGVFALYAEAHHEAPGAPGGGLEIVDATGAVHRIVFRCGQHYDDAFILDPVDRTTPEGIQITTISSVDTMDGKARVDMVSIPVPPNLRPRKIVFRDLQTSASFIIFDVFVEAVNSPACPFRGQGKGVTFHEMSAILRARDRDGFEQVIEQAKHGIMSCAEIDEARGAALLFLGNVCCHVLDAGAPRSRHGFMISVARELDKVSRKQDIAGLLVSLTQDLVSPLFSKPAATTADLVRRALETVARRYATPLRDSQLAQELGLSPSHFRYLFKTQTGRPFHQYVLTYRLEKSKELLGRSNKSIQQVAQLTGFSSQAHFCRAFAKTYGVVPTAFRDQFRSGKAS